MDRFIPRDKLSKRARKALDKGGNIYVRAERENGSYRIRVLDNGRGMPEEAIRHLTSDERMDYLRQSSPNDSVYLKLQDRLSASTDVAERHKLAINMERCRWQLKKPQADERRVLVNLPAQQLWAMCPDTIINMRICFGKKSTKTPLLASGISRIDVNAE